MTLNEYQKKPILTADGKKWCQNCYCCNGQIDFLKAPKESYVVIVGNTETLVRHKKCSPGMPK